MATTLAVAGATGNLGGRIVTAALKRGASVRALVRKGADAAALEGRGVDVRRVDYADGASLAEACRGVACVVSTLQGLGDVIVDVQTRLLDAAILAGVPRFIPSDFSIDFMKLLPGENRNLDFRRAFAERLDKAAIAATSILNGAFAELLTTQMRILDFDAKRATYWGDADQRMDFTTMDDPAAFTAAAALDASTPRVLRVAGDEISTRELAAVAGELVGAKFDLVCAGSVEDLAAFIRRERAADPESEKQPYPRWQGMQYRHGMSSGLAKLEPLDNDRYPDLRFTTVREVLAAR